VDGEEKTPRIIVIPHIGKSCAWEYFHGPCQGEPQKLGQEEFYIWRKLKVIVSKKHWERVQPKKKIRRFQDIH
jgi:hypothetical protein